VETLGNRNSGDFHIPMAPTAVTLSPQTKTKPKNKILWDGGKVEIQNPDFHFPTVPVCLRRKEERPEGGSSSQQQE
jgi:hypothetical protein